MIANERNLDGAQGRQRTGGRPGASEARIPGSNARAAFGKSTPFNVRPRRRADRTPIRRGMASNPKKPPVYSLEYKLCSFLGDDDGGRSLGQSAAPLPTVLPSSADYTRICLRLCIPNIGRRENMAAAERGIFFWPIAPLFPSPPPALFLSVPCIFSLFLSLPVLFGERKNCRDISRTVTFKLKQALSAG